MGRCWWLAAFGVVLGGSPGLAGLGGCGEQKPSAGLEILRAEDGSASDGVQLAVAPEVAAADVAPSVVVSAELKNKLVELSVAGECARREGVPNERAVPRLEALFAAQGVTLAEYSDAMGALSGDAEVHEAIARRLGSCGTLVEALWPKLADEDAGAQDAVAQDAGVLAGVGTDTGGSDLPDQVDGVGAVDTAGPEDVAAGPEDVAVTPDVKVEPRPAPSWSGTWVGALSGSQKGTLRVTIAGRVVTGAVATFGRSTLRLKGSMSDKGYLSLGGTAGDEFVRLSGRIDKSGQVITGTWDGVVGRKRTNGSLRLSR